MSVSWGEYGGGTGMVSVEYTFEGETAHSAGAPWRGRSAARRRGADECIGVELSP